jgi:hypothetical protein
MIIDRVTYQKIFPTGMAYLNHKIGVEVALDEDDSPDQAFDLAKATVEQWNKESNPSMGLAMEYFKTDQPIPELDPKKQDLLDRIKDSTSMIELNVFTNDAMKYGLVEEFLEKKKSLK